jgi:hypothetical protein
MDNWLTNPQVMGLCVIEKRKGRKPDPNSENQKLLARRKEEKLKIVQKKRAPIILAINRVKEFCELHLFLPASPFDKKMLEMGNLFASNSLAYLQGDEWRDDIPLGLFLSDYDYIVLALSRVGVDFIGDFIPYGKSPEKRAELRKVWNVSVGNKKHPTFLGFLVP